MFYRLVSLLLTFSSIIACNHIDDSSNYDYYDGSSNGNSQWNARNWKNPNRKLRGDTSFPPSVSSNSGPGKFSSSSPSSFQGPPPASLPTPSISPSNGSSPNQKGASIVNVPGAQLSSPPIVGADPVPLIQAPSFSGSSSIPTAPSAVGTFASATATTVPASETDSAKQTSDLGDTSPNGGRPTATVYGIVFGSIGAVCLLASSVYFAIKNYQKSADDTDVDNLKGRGTETSLSETVPTAVVHEPSKVRVLSNAHPANQSFDFSYYKASAEKQGKSYEVYYY
jgi:hypothetical protein